MAGNIKKSHGIERCPGPQMVKESFKKTMTQRKKQPSGLHMDRQAEKTELSLL